LFDRHRHGFVALRADCTPGVPLQLVVEQTLPSPPSGDQRRVST
jgi:8-oxo-dGTP diphosphatase